MSKKVLEFSGAHWWQNSLGSNYSGQPFAVICVACEVAQGRHKVSEQSFDMCGSASHAKAFDTSKQ